MRSILSNRGHNYDFGTAIPNSVVFEVLCSYFDISLVKTNKRYIINKEFYVSE